MDTRKNKLYENNVFILSFIIPIFVMLGIYIARGIYPFGNKCFLRTDMYHQYAPFFSEFYYKLKNGLSLQYSWNVGMGVNFSALYAYYLASPMNFIVFLSPSDYIIEVMSILIIFKIALSSLTFTIYISKHYNTKNPCIVVFSIFYGLSSYIAAYSWNIMWLDCILLLPLIVLGLEQLVYKNKCLLYCISLGLCILSNYYISIMVCIFLIFYFLGLIFTFESADDAPKYYVKFFNFGFYSILAAGLAAFLIIPEFYALQLTASGEFDFPRELKTYFTLFDIASRHLMNVEASVLNGNFPNVYSGVAVLMLFPLYIMSRYVDTKQKIFKIILLAIFMVSFNMNIPNFIWHGFHFPNSLPCRQSYIYIFLMLTMCYEAFRWIKYYTNNQIYGVFWAAFAFVFITEKLLGDDGFPIYVIYVSAIFIALYLLVIYLYRTKMYKNITVYLLLLAITVIEATTNMAVTSVSTVTRENYIGDYKDIKIATDLLSTQDTDFYRIEKLNSRTKNDTAWHNIKGVSLFSSIASEPVTKLLGNLGFAQSTNAYCFDGATPLTSALFSVKYLLNDKALDASDLISLHTTQGKIFLYENNYTLPLGFMIDPDAANAISSGNNPFAVQNTFVMKAVNKAPIFNDLRNSAKNGTVTITNPKTQRVYAYIQTSNVEKITVNYDGNVKEYELDKKQQIVDLGLCEKDKPITLKNEAENGTLKVSSYALDEDNFIEAYNEFNKNPLIINHHDETNINGIITATQDGLLFTSIPYEKGWHVWVDSKEVTPIAFEDALIALNLNKGTHTVEFHYEPEGLNIGKAISISCLIVLALIITIKRCLRLKNKPAH